MAWDNLSWWLRQRDALQRGAAPPFVRPQPTPKELTDRLVVAVQERLARGGGVDVSTLPEGVALLERASEDGGALAVALVEAMKAWPAGVDRPELRSGLRVIERVADEVLRRSTLRGPQVVVIARGAAQVKMAPDQLSGLLDAVERCVEEGMVPPGLVEALGELRHGLPLEARGLRHRLQQLMQRARPG